MKLLNELKIKQIFKGDQNLFWDAFITDSSIAYQLNVKKSNLLFTPFIHDEKFGAPDQNLTHCLEKPEDSFFISEDYADSAGDATYLNLDISYGIFYLPVVSEARLKEFYISPKSISHAYTKLYKQLDVDFIDRCSWFGLFLDFESYHEQGSGDIPNREELNCFFEIHPEQRIFYIFSRAIGRYGVAPIKDNNILLSSVFMNDSNLAETTQILLKDYLLRGLLEQANPEDHVQIKKRYQLIEISCIKTKNKNGSVADLEKNITENVLKTLKENFRFNLTRSSSILSQHEAYQIKHYYLKSFIENNDMMSEIYNNSLNQTKMSIQRIRKGDTLVNLPFYLNKKDKKNRFIRSELLLDHSTGKLVFKNNIDLETYQKDETSFISGKAIPFLNEFRLDNHIIALPEHGSKYTPACDAFIMNARANKIAIPEASVLRVSIHFLDQLKIAQNKILILPKILVPYFGTSITCIELSRTWREKTDNILQLLNQLKSKISDGKETDMAKTILNEFKTNQEKTKTFFRFMDTDMLDLLLELTEQYQNILKERLNQNISSTLNLQYRIVSFKIKLLVRYYMQQLLQVHDGLLYLNDRPYSLALYLMFGSEFLEELIKNVTFRIETV
jgi:hypothetical protein